jgi:hypothetical protein
MKTPLVDALLVLAVAFVLAVIPSQGQAHCSNATVAGNWAYTYTGTIFTQNRQTKESNDFPVTPDSSNRDDFGPGVSLTSPIADLPQPASLGMLALGAQGVPTWGRKGVGTRRPLIFSSMPFASAATGLSLSQAWPASRIFPALRLYPSDTERILPRWVGIVGLRHNSRHKHFSRGRVVAANRPGGVEPPRWRITSG